MKFYNKFFLFVILYVAICIVVVMVAKKSIKHFDYEKYLNESDYTIVPEDFLNNGAGFSEYIIHNSISNIDYLYNSIILVISVDKNPSFIGNGIINNCKIEKVIKGDNLTEGEEIQIYDLVSYWKMSYTSYLGGSTPLKKNNKYLVFISKTERANKNNTYVFSSVPYGHIQINSELKTLLYNQSPETSISVKEAQDYQFLFDMNANQELVDLYKKNCNDLLNKYILD